MDAQESSSQGHAMSTDSPSDSPRADNISGHHGQPMPFAAGFQGQGQQWDQPQPQFGNQYPGQGQPPIPWGQGQPPAQYNQYGAPLNYNQGPYARVTPPPSYSAAIGQQQCM